MAHRYVMLMLGGALLAVACGDSDDSKDYLMTVCTPGDDGTCNDGPFSMVAGSCNPDGTCSCGQSFEVNPATGRCRAMQVGVVVGEPCVTHEDCGEEYACYGAVSSAPFVTDGYCVVADPTSGLMAACMDDGECPAGALCSPLPWAAIPGVCMRACDSDMDCRTGYECDIVELFPGEPGTPTSSGEVCWLTDDVCVLGDDMSCNHDPTDPTARGTCSADLTCECNAGYEVNGTTGRCQPCYSASYPPDCIDVDYYQCGFDAACDTGVITATWHEHTFCAGVEDIVDFTCTHACAGGCDPAAQMIWPNSGQELVDNYCL